MPIFNEADAESYEAPEPEFDWSTAPDQMENEDSRNAEYEQYLIDAENSGIGGSLIDNLKKVWTTGGKVVDSVGAFAKANPALTSMITSGVGTAMSNKQRAELAQQQNQYQIDKEGRAKADAKELWDRRNQSIIDTQPAKLGILGGGMLDKHVAYLQNRKKA